LNFLRRLHGNKSNAEESEDNRSSSSDPFDSFFSRYVKEQNNKSDPKSITRAMARGDENSLRQQDADTYERTLFARQHWLQQISKLQTMGAKLSKPEWSLNDSVELMQAEVRKAYLIMANKRRITRWQTWIVYYGVIIKAANFLFHNWIPGLNNFDTKMAKFAKDPETLFYLDEVSERFDSKLPSSPEWHLLTGLLGPVLLGIGAKIISYLSPIKNTEAFFKMLFNYDKAFALLKEFKDAMGVKSKKPKKAQRSPTAYPQEDPEAEEEEEEEEQEGGEEGGEGLGGGLAALSSMMSGFMKSNFLPKNDDSRAAAGPKIPAAGLSNTPTANSADISEEDLLA
jgi:hypothetical protein